MKKLHIVFAILAGVMTLAATVVALIMYAGTAGDPTTSLPAWTAFVFVAIYYAAGLVILGVAWLVAYLILRHIACKNRENII